MKKHLVLVVGSFYPNPSPTGKCAEAYVDLLKDKFDITVVCLADMDRVPYEYKDKQVYPTAGWYTLLQHRLKKNAPALLQNIAKIPVHLRQGFTQPNNLYSYVKAARMQLENVHKRRPIDVVLSVAAPMAAHVAAYKFRNKHPNVRWITYTVDSYAAQNKGSIKAHQFETNILSQCDCVLLSEEIYEANPNLYESFVEKCKPLPYLMPPTQLRLGDVQYFSKDKVNLVYAGRFYKSIRNPEYLLQLALEMDDNCVLHLYCRSDCESMIDGYVSRSAGKIVRHTPVSVEEIQQIYKQADILVSVGNNTPEFKPSKTFEYIASGKPILNIYYEGLCDTVLERYPLALQLQRDGMMKKDVETLSLFVKGQGNKFLSEREINELFQEHSGSNIKSILGSAMSV